MIYPVAMIDLSPFCTQIISHNSVIVIKFQVQRCALIPLRVPSFSLIGACIHILWLKIQSVRNEDEEEEKTKIRINFARSYLGNL